MDDNDDVSGFDFNDCIFLTEGQVCSKMPIRKDCYYILHNVPKIEGIGKSVNIQYLTFETKAYPEIAKGIHLVGDDGLCFPWGSPFLPHEFNEDDVVRERTDDIYYLGTVDNRETIGGNYEKIWMFAHSAMNDGHKTYVGGGYTGDKGSGILNYISGWISESDQYSLLRTAYMQPALQGERQLKNGMIPCRLFKSISCGLDGITNNFFAASFFDNHVIYDDDMFSLYVSADLRKCEIERRVWLMHEVKTYHTYLQRVENILKVLL